MKCCSSCTRWKRDAEFYPDRRPGRSRDGRLHSCIACERDVAAKRARARYVPTGAARQVPLSSASGQTQPRDAMGRYRHAA